MIGHVDEDEGRREEADGEDEGLLDNINEEEGEGGEEAEEEHFHGLSEFANNNVAAFMLLICWRRICGGTTVG